MSFDRYDVLLMKENHNDKGYLHEQITKTAVVNTTMLLTKDMPLKIKQKEINRLLKYIKEKLMKEIQNG